MFSFHDLHSLIKGAANMSEVDLLRAEIADLQSRLSAADREKAQAGELGLQLLQEKELLERQLEQLQKEHDAARTELDETKQVFIKLIASDDIGSKRNET